MEWSAPAGRGAFAVRRSPFAVRRSPPPGALESAVVGDCSVTRDDLVLGDDDGVLFVPSRQAEKIFTLAETIRAIEWRQAERIRAGVSLRSQVRFGDF
jgi:regulator of RNase E activity RraA